MLRSLNALIVYWRAIIINKIIISSSLLIINFYHPPSFLSVRFVVVQKDGKRTGHAHLFYYQCSLLFTLFYAKMIAMNIINIYENYNSYFNADLKAIFEHCSKIAFKSGYKLYLIGGIVRDLLLNKESLDIDITVEGDAIEFAKILGVNAKENVKILNTHENFGTTKIEISGYKIDLASTRSEVYPKKGHLPVIEKIGCSLQEDVLRRDFTINSLAISLNQENFADLIDYVGGFEDLKTKKIRILHDKSFIDDPTRIIRALKYSSRLDFELEENTSKLQKEYLQNINYDMCYKRVKQEFKKTFEQGKNRALTFEKFIEQGIYKLIGNFTSHPNPTSRKRYSIVTSAESQGARGIENLINKYKPKNPWLVYFGVIIINKNFKGFELTKYEKEVIEGAESLQNKFFSNDFQIYKTFSAQKLETLLILAALGKNKEVMHYLDHLRKIKLSISGNDILKLGFTPSKAFSEGFDYVLKEKLRRPNMTKIEELDLIAEWLNQVPD